MSNLDVKSSRHKEHTNSKIITFVALYLFWTVHKKYCDRALNTFLL